MVQAYLYDKVLPVYLRLLPGGGDWTEGTRSKRGEELRLAAIMREAEVSKLLSVWARHLELSDVIDQDQVTKCIVRPSMRPYDPGLTPVHDMMGNCTSSFQERADVDRSKAIDLRLIEESKILKNEWKVLLLGEFPVSQH